MSDDERAIREVIANWMNASLAGDSRTVLSLMTDDVIFLVAGRPPFGKKEFAANQRPRVKTSSGLAQYSRSFDGKLTVIGGWPATPTC
jgi:uncharacterized protein (TIGR02246 family)